MFGTNFISIEEDFKLLRQAGDIDEFIDKYDEMRGLMSQVHLYLTKTYFLNNHISCLKRAIRCFVRTSRLTTMLETYCLAKEFEENENHLFLS